jgi:UDP-2-acetamido-2,6-beta-L-arabino-hexul-4-ose reductase
MVVGSGMLAKSFYSYKYNDEVVIFASGVSNSKETDSYEFEREKKLLLQVIKENELNKLIYFSTCSINDNSMSSSPYVKHKISMESMIQKICNDYHIFRLPQVVGYSNSPTIVNYLYKSITENIKFVVYKYATRNLIDVDDVFEISDYLINNNLYSNEITNIATTHNCSIIDIVSLLERIVDKKATFTIEASGEKQSIDIDRILAILEERNILLEGYPNLIIKKYYENRCLGSHP